MGEQILERIRKIVRKQDKEVQCRIREFLDLDLQKRKIPGNSATRREGHVTAISGGNVSATTALSPGSATGIIAY